MRDDDEMRAPNEPFERRAEGVRMHAGATSRRGSTVAISGGTASVWVA
jgi:hypothetical protein